MLKANARLTVSNKGTFEHRPHKRQSRCKERDDYERVVQKSVRYACPFAKHNPQRHRSTACRYPGFSGVFRMKEHLYRCHFLVQCKRCRLTFRHEHELENHQRQAEPCIVNDVDCEEGIDTVQRARLKSRRKFGSESTESEKWLAIYWYLFPGDTTYPITPYCEYEAPVSPNSERHLRDFEQFAQRELLYRFKRALQAAQKDGYYSIDADAETKILDMLRRCQLPLLEDFQREQRIIQDRSCREESVQHQSPQYELSQDQTFSIQTPPELLSFNSTLSATTAQTQLCTATSPSDLSTELNTGGCSPFTPISPLDVPIPFMDTLCDISAEPWPTEHRPSMRRLQQAETSTFPPVLHLNNNSFPESDFTWNTDWNFASSLS